MCGRLVSFPNASLSIGALLFSRWTRYEQGPNRMTERSKRESLILGAIVGAVIAMGVIVPIIALSV